jgi:hypothetical protein
MPSALFAGNRESTLCDEYPSIAHVSPSQRRLPEEITMHRAVTRAIVILTTASQLVGAQAAPIWFVGGESERESQLGRPRRVLVAREMVIVLEADPPFLKIFDRHGRLIQHTGKSGGGPGEFRRPSSMWFDEVSGRLWVVDGTNLRATTYALGDSLSDALGLRLPEPSIRAICRLNGTLIGMADNSPMMLRRLSEVGGELSVQASFGPATAVHALGKMPQVRSLAAGVLGCDNQENRLVIGSIALGEVHRVSADGGRFDVEAIPAFQGNRLAIENGALVSDRPRSGFYDLLVDIVLVNGRQKAAVRRWTTDAGGAQKLEGYYVVDVDSARLATEVRVRSWRPSGVLGRRSVCVQDDPYPTVALFEGPCP